MHFGRESQLTLRVQSLPPLLAHSLDHPYAQGCSEQPNHGERCFYKKKCGYSHSVLSLSLTPSLSPFPCLSFALSLPPSSFHLSRQMHLQFICEVVHAISDMVGVCQLSGQGHAWPGVFQHTQQVTLIHVLFNQQQRIVPVMNRNIILCISLAQVSFSSVINFSRWAAITIR